MSGTRSIQRVIPGTINGPLVRLIGTVDLDGHGTEHALDQVDPFVLCDYAVMDRTNMPPFGLHPHVGHSVGTILLQGQVKVVDSFHPSNDKILTGPAMAWMDGGTGVFHEETSVIADATDPSQHVRLLQLWVGVPESDRNMAPNLQVDEDLQTHELKDATTGNVVCTATFYLGGPQSSIVPPHPVTVIHVMQEPRSTFHCPVRPAQEGFVVQLAADSSTTSFSGTTGVRQYDVMVLEDGDEDVPDHLAVQTFEEKTEYLVCFGEKHASSWSKLLVANGAVIASTPEEARQAAEKVMTASVAGKEEGGSFAPFGV